MLRRNRQMVRNQNVSDEELQKTQVLNLADFKEAARIERVCSKKPAIIVAILGVMAISIGTLFPAVQSFSARRNAREELNSIQPRRASRESIEDQPIVEDISCVLKTLNKANGTDEEIDVVYSFEEGKLVSFQKDFILTQSATVTEPPEELEIYMNALQPFLIQMEGYSLTVKTLPNGSISTTKVDYSTLNMAEVPEKHQKNYRFNILYKANTSMEEVKRDMVSRGYICVEE